MKSSQTFASFVALVGVAAVACAKGSSADPADLNRPVEPTKTVEPTEPEPPPESVTVPPSSGTDASAPSTESGSGDTTTDGGTSASDAGSSCSKTGPSKACGLAPQCGCSGTETCEITDRKTGAVSCVASGESAVGSVCTETKECGKGLTCAFGACRPYCASVNSKCSGPGVGTCTQAYDSSGTAMPNGMVCTIPCDLLEPSKACGTNSCVWDASAKATDCDRLGTRSAGEPCSSLSDCEQGLGCAKHPILGMQCQKWCHVGKDDECGSPLLKCKDVYGANAPKAGSETLGHCQ